MNKLFFALFLVAFGGAMCLAEEASIPASDNTATSVLISGDGVQPPQNSSATVVTSQAPEVDNAANSVLVSGDSAHPPETSGTPAVEPQFSSTPAVASQDTGSVVTSKAPDSAPAVIPVKPLTFTGIVDLISSSQLVLNNGKGEQTPFAMASDVTVIDKDGKATTLIWISKGTKVSIEYVTAEGSTKIVKSIKVLSAW